MKVLVINGSPKGKRSNTYKLTESFLEGMKSVEEASLEIEEIQVNRMEIQPCLGCFSCWSKTPGSCCIEDDMQRVIQKLLWADVTIWSFPLYYYTVPGGLKNLIDRQLPMVLPFMEENREQTGSGSHPSRYDMSGKKTVVISTCGFYSAEGNYDGVRSLFDHMCGRGAYTEIFCGQGELFRVPELSGRTNEYLDYVRKAGAEYVKGGICSETGEELKRLLFPKEVFESMADASWGIDRESGQTESDTLIFTRQMAALYRKESYSGRERVLEMAYTDVDECYQIVLGKDGSRVLTDGFLKADTRIETPVTVWRSIAAGEIRGDEALMRSLYRVTGDFDMMLKWDDYFGASGADSEGAASEQKITGIHMPRKSTDMCMLLIPWIVFWAAAPIDGRIGSLLSIVVCAVIPLLYYQNQKTIYDVLTGILVTGFSVTILLGLATRLAVPLAYLAFGVMWAASCLGKVPLTAHYSMNAYHGESALLNPIFLKTNRILTALWGILYLVTPVWTYAIMGTETESLVGAINCVLPALMGIFTAWFQKWYPAKIARG